MAKKTKVKSNDKTTDAFLEGGALPEGFEEISGERVAGWFHRAAGNTLQGLMQENFEVKSRFRRDSDGKNKKRVYKILTTTSGTLLAPTEEGGKPEVAGTAVLIGLDESGWLKRLVDVEIGREVFVKCLGKSAPTESAPQGEWRFTVARAKEGKTRRPARANGVTGELE